MDQLKAYIQKKHQEMDQEAPGAYAWEQLSKSLQRLPNADTLEIQLMIDRPLLDLDEPNDNLWKGIQSTLDGGSTDGLKQYIQSNRPTFDMMPPPNDLWDRIAGQVPALSAPKSKVVALGWHHNLAKLAAAVAILIVGIGLGVWYATPALLDQGMAMSEVSSEYAEIEEYYQGDITKKQAHLANFTSTQSAEITQDLDQLDHIMQELKVELSKVPPGNREQVVRAMIENYKAKASILERVLDRLDTSNTNTPTNSENENNKQFKKY